MKSPKRAVTRPGAMCGAISLAVLAILVSALAFPSPSAPAQAWQPDAVQGQLIQNGSFEEQGGSLSSWQTSSWATLGTAAPGTAYELHGGLSMPGPGPRGQPAPGIQGDESRGVGIQEIGAVSGVAVDGSYAARMTRSGNGGDVLFQDIAVPAGITDLIIQFWYRLETQETTLREDWFCAGLWMPDLSGRPVDVGCADPADTAGRWQEAVYTLRPEEVQAVAGQTVTLMFELYNEGQAGSTSSVWIDAVGAQALGGGGGSYLDPNEPNDGSGEAKTIACGDTISGTIGDALGGEDEDWFVVHSVPPGQIEVDLSASDQPSPSELDSVVGIWASSGSGVELLAQNDDDGVSYDSYVTYTVPSAGTYYVRVGSLSGDGGPGSFYDLAVRCASSGTPPTPPTPPPPQKAWTVMLYLNGEDPTSTARLTQYRADIEAWIGAKSGFLDVLILYDGPGQGDAMRYWVQPGGVYTPDVNVWNVGELNMGQRDTLANFVSWAMDNYPAQRTYLAVDDHGDGVYGISADNHPGHDQLTPPELYAALKRATLNGRRKIDLFDYEAPLMGLAENAYDLRPWADYVVFSEQIHWALNTYPRYLSDLAATDTPLDLGRRIVARYHEEALAANGGRGYPHTISLVDTSKMVQVRDALSAFGVAAQSASTNLYTIYHERYWSQAFASDIEATNSERGEYIDLWDLADETAWLVPGPAAAVKAAVEAAVVDERHASGAVGGHAWVHHGAHGLAVYYPRGQWSSAFERYTGPYLYRMSQDGTWDEFLLWAVPAHYRRGISAYRAEDKYDGQDAAIFWVFSYLPLMMDR